MNHSRLTRKLFPAALLFFICSCGNNADKATTESTSSDTTTSQEVSTPVTASTITTKSENMMVVRHRTGGYEKWKPSYDMHDSMRIAYGLHNYVLGRSVEDSNMIIVAVKADDMDRAKAFTKNPDLQKVMKKGGVTGPPTIQFITTVFQDTAVIASKMRAMNTMTVKDRDAWQKAFNEGKQERLDNGIVDRLIGHDVDNDKKIILVVAIIDTSKAFAYWKSDLLKKRREESGVIGTPERFVFEILKRY